MTETTIWVVYKHPTDYPDKYVARCFVNDEPMAEHFVSNTLDKIRRKFDKFDWIPRSDEDDKHILGCYFV